MAILSFSKLYSELSTGNSPQKTTGLLGLKPGRGFSAGNFAWVIVSPTFVSDKSLIPVTIKPISPGPSSLVSNGFGVK